MISSIIMGGSDDLYISNLKNIFLYFVHCFANRVSERIDSRRSVAAIAQIFFGMRGAL